MIPLLFLLFSAAFADELISARCQSKCLSDMEARYQDNHEQRRNLRHHIIQMCKDDATCSACTAPCRESFSDVPTCKASVCEDSLDKPNCEESCEHLHLIYSEKPGTCPPLQNTSNYECSALCHLDGDCGETAKCCSYGCSRQCVLPMGKDPRLLPVPLSISVQERKRKRSIIIRWVMQQLTKEQTSSNSNLFVVQWRWGIHTDSQSMTEWQTVTVRNKPYAILKHLLSPGRFYEFRVGAVSTHGSLGFSKPSQPFKLSKEAKAPQAPRELSLGSSKLTPVGLWNQVIQWSPPSSDLPIKTYQVSWAASSRVEADAFEEMMRRRATLETHEKRSTDDEDEWGIEHRDRHSVVVPSHSNHAEIAGLFPNSVYIVEIHASVESTEGELQGEKGIIFVRTKDAFEPQTTQMFSSPTPASLPTHDLNVPTSESVGSSTPVSLIDIQTPFFDQELQAGINWLNSRICAPGRTKFAVRVKKGLCREYQPHHHLEARWNDIRVEDCAAVIRGLSFDCDYHVQVTELSTDQTISSMFATQPCSATPSHTPIPCLTLTTPILCTAHAASVACHWNKDRGESRDTVIGYRVVLSSPTTALNNISINPPQVREIFYEGLQPGEMYTVQVQAVTNRGLGREISTNFVAPSILLDENDDILQRFPGGQIIELPLEAKSSNNLFIYTFSIILFRLI